MQQNWNVRKSAARVYIYVARRRFTVATSELAIARRNKKGWDVWQKTYRREYRKSQKTQVKSWRQSDGAAPRDGTCTQRDGN